MAEYCDKCASETPTPSTSQTLDEMDFERGIWCAAKDGDLDRVKMLLNKGVSPDAIDSSGYRALHYAARNGHYDVCKELLNHGANVNAITRCMGATPLHRAVMQGHLNIVKMLLQHGADPSIKDADGKTALDRVPAIPTQVHLVMTSIATILLECRQKQGMTLSEELERAEETIHRFLGQEALADFRENLLSSMSKKLKEHPCSEKNAESEKQNINERREQDNKTLKVENKKQNTEHK